MRRILYGAHISADYIFNQHCKNQMMNAAEFKELLTSLCGKMADYEIKSIFSELDNTNTGMIAKDRFLIWFGKDEQEHVFEMSMEDILKPLVTIMNHKNCNVTNLFRDYDQNKNDMLSAEELKAALLAMVKFEMTQEEVGTMQQFFKNKFRRSEVKKAEFSQLVNTGFKR